MRFTRLRVSTSILAGLTLVGILTDSPARAQFGFSVVTDPTQEAHSLKQLVNDIQKLQKQRDAITDHLNYETMRDQYLVSEGPQWGTASQAITSARLQ